MPRLWTLEDELLKNFRLWVLEQCGWNRTQAAEILGLSDRGLRLNVRRYKEQGEYIPTIQTVRSPLANTFNTKVWQMVTFADLNKEERDET